MAKLTTKQRKKLPKKDFGLPGERKYPMPDKIHARVAKSYASKMENEGKLSEAQKEKIDKKADKILDKGKKKKAEPKKAVKKRAVKKAPAKRAPAKKAVAKNKPTSRRK